MTLKLVKWDLLTCLHTATHYWILTAEEEGMLHLEAMPFTWENRFWYPITLVDGGPILEELVSLLQESIHVS